MKKMKKSIFFFFLEKGVSEIWDTSLIRKWRVVYLNASFSWFAAQTAAAAQTATMAEKVTPETKKLDDQQQSMKNCLWILKIINSVI